MPVKTEQQSNKTNSPFISLPDRPQSELSDLLNIDNYCLKWKFFDIGISNHIQDKIAKIYNDPFVFRTEWMPMENCNSTGYSIVTSTPDKVVLCKGKIPGYVALILIFIGMLFLSSSILPAIINNEPFNTDGHKNTIGWLLFGSLFTVIGSGLLFTKNMLCVFDKSRGLFWKGQTDSISAHEAKKYDIRLSTKQIYAIQTVSFPIVIQNSEVISDYSYQLNLVLNDGNRVYVASYAQTDTLACDAKKLAEILGTPLWDAVHCSKTTYDNYKYG